MTIEELSKKLNISISNIRTNFPRVYKKFLDQGIKIEREGKYPNTIYNILYLPNNEEIEKEKNKSISCAKNYSIDVIKNEIFKEYTRDENLLISNMGRYKWKNNSNKIWIGHNTPDGYKKITIKGKSYFVHRIVLETFSPIKDSENYTVDHINGKRNDNRLENLRWAPLEENIFLMLMNRKDLNKELTRIIQKYGYEETLKILQEIK